MWSALKDAIQKKTFECTHAFPVAGTAKKIFKTINPSNRTPKRKEAWDNAKGMLKDLLFQGFESLHNWSLRHPGGLQMLVALTRRVRAS